MMLKTKSGHKINVDDHIEQMKMNLSLNRDPFERTPIGKTAQGGYFWWDEKKNPHLDKRSVNSLVKAINKVVVTEQKEWVIGECTTTQSNRR